MHSNLEIYAINGNYILSIYKVECKSDIYFCSISECIISREAQWKIWKIQSEINSLTM